MFEVNEKILVVDDEKSIVDILKFNLQKEGFQVFTGSDGQEALEIFENCHPDLLILDVMMPRLSGYDVCRKIREKSMVPIIIIKFFIYPPVYTNMEDSILRLSINTTTTTKLIKRANTDKAESAVIMTLFFCVLFTA